MILSELIEKARQVKMTEEERKLQRISFAYGNAHLSNPEVTRKMVEEMAEKMEMNELE